MKRLADFSRFGAVLFASLMLMVSTSLRAQDEGEQTDTGVARVSLIRGDVQMMRGDSGDQVAAKVNMPLVRGDKVFTGDKSQAEIQLDHSNVIRLAPGTEVRIADLTRSVIQVQVARGLVSYSVLKSNEADIELDTPNMAVRPIKEGTYRIQVDSPSQTQLIVRKGDADVSTPEGTTQVKEGRMIVVRGEDRPEYQLAKAPGRDQWDNWNRDRDNEIANAKSYKYANQYYTGAQDLDRNGRWVYIPDYGDYAWTPYVGVGWSPYYSGYWGWQPYWGWTWISYEPWGWAPYHYGRWFYHGSSWYWWPGRRHYGYRPIWGPAWVSFIGFGYGGHNWSFGFGYGYSSIGWCALGPYDRHYAWWGRHNGYRSVNITNITNITNVTNINNYNRGGRGSDSYGRTGYRSNLERALTNDKIRGGITRVSTEDFSRGNFGRAQRGLDADTFRKGQLVQGRIPAAPTRESLRPVENGSRIAQAKGNENFFSRRQAPAVERNFNEQSASVQNMMRNHNALDAGNGRTAAANGNSQAGFANSRGNAPRQDLSRGGTGSATNRTATGNSGERTAQSSAAPARSGWNRFGQGSSSANAGGDIQIAQSNGRASQAPAQQPSATGQQDRGWRRFGDRTAPGKTNSTPGTTNPQAGGEGRSQSPQGNSRDTGWRQSPSQGTRGNAPANVQGGQAPAQRQATPEAGTSRGWRRFGQTSSSSAGSDRPALSIRKSITTERAAPRSFERSLSGNSTRRSQPSGATASPSSSRPAPRSFERGSSGSNGAARPAPSSSPRTFSNGSSTRGSAPSAGRSSSGSSSRGWSQPSRGSSASAPSRSSGGSSRSVSRPSGGSSAGRGGWSAPSRGSSRSTSAPSGGRSSSSSGGRGRR